jgi:hypothetical protein
MLHANVLATSGVKSLDFKKRFHSVSRDSNGHIYLTIVRLISSEGHAVMMLGEEAALAAFFGLR